MIGLLLKHWDKALIGAVLVFGITMCRERDEALRREGAASAEAANLEVKVAVLREEADSLSAAFKKDTVFLVKKVTRYEQLRDTLRLTDTVRVKEALKAADTAIQGCRLTLQTCSRLVAVRDSIAAKTDSIYSARERLIRSQHRVEVIRWSLISLLLGAAVAAFQMN